MSKQQQQQQKKRYNLYLNWGTIEHASMSGLQRKIRPCVTVTYTLHYGCTMGCGIEINYNGASSLIAK